MEAEIPLQICAGSHTVQSGWALSGWKRSVGRLPLARMVPERSKAAALRLVDPRSIPTRTGLPFPGAPAGRPAAPLTCFPGA